MPNNNNTFVPGRHVTNGSISGIVLTQRGYLVRVLNTNTNTPFWFDAVDLRGTRGRPGIVHPSGLCQFDVNAFSASSHQRFYQWNRAYPAWVSGSCAKYEYQHSFLV